MNRAIGAPVSDPARSCGLTPTRRIGDQRSGRFLESSLQRPVIDRIGPTANFDIHFEKMPVRKATTWACTSGVEKAGPSWLASSIKIS